VLRGGRRGGGRGEGNAEREMLRYKELRKSM
jgi:hypothetical protein